MERHWPQKAQNHRNGFLAAFDHFWGWSFHYLIYIRGSHLREHPRFFHAGHSQFGFGGEYALFEAHHGKRVLKFSDLGFYFGSSGELNQPVGKVGAGGDRKRDAAGKTRVDFDQAYILSIPFALNV